MANRSQRRAAKHNPKIKEQVNNMAMEMAKSFFGEFEKTMDEMKKSGNFADGELTGEKQKEWFNKGKEFGEFVKRTANQMDVAMKDQAKQKNKQNNVKVNMRSQ